MSRIVLLTIRPILLLGLLSLIVTFFIFGCSGPYETNDPQELKSHYKEEFGVTPPTSVKVLGFKYTGAGDSEVRFYRFEANAEVVDALVSKGFVICSESVFDAETKGASPSWWRPAEDKLTSFYYAENWDKHGTSATTHAWLGVNSAKTMVYVFVGLSF